ncbi:ABC transporter ATP-binding protein [bacterium]|nr:ABC transporter ATP-binding protein [bacterium]
MPRYMHIADEDFKGRKLYDARLMRRLFAYAKPYKLLLFVAFIMLMTAGVIEIYLPYIQRQAIDKYIVLNVQMLSFGEHSDFRQRFFDRYGKVLFKVGEDSFVIDGAWLDPADMKQAIATGLVIPEKFYALRIDDYPPALRDSVRKLISNYPQKFIPVIGPTGDKVIAPHRVKLPFSRQSLMKKPDYVISYESLASIPPEQLKVLRSRDLAGIVKIGIIYLLLLIISFLANFGQVYSLNKVAQQVMHDLRVEVFAHIQKLSLRFFDNTPVGKIVTRATNDINTIAEMFTSVLVGSLKDLLTLVGIGAILFYMSWRLSLLVVALLPVIVVVTVFFRRALREAYRAFRKALSAVNTKLSENLAGMKIIQAFVQETRMLEDFDRVNEEFYRSSMRMLWVNAIFRPIVAFFINLATALTIWYGGGQVIHQAMSLGMLVAYLTYINMFFRPIQALADKFSILQSAMAASERVFDILDTEPEIKNPPKPYKPSPEQVRGKVEFRNVWFAYKDEEWVLKDVSFVVEPGQKVAIVGATGAGKTTITAVLTRMYDVQRGQILVDDVDIRQWDVDTLRRCIGIVLQDVFLFSTNIMENIRLGEESITPEQVEQAAKIVNAYEFIKNLPQGFLEPVAERGATLSAGQRQLLSFARALVFEPRILILDEATASIDTHTEVLIQDAIDKLLEGRTSIIIAHRLSTIRRANTILVMYKGRIIERGTHQQLLERGGYYAKLYEFQFKFMNNNRNSARA